MMAVTTMTTVRMTPPAKMIPRPASLKPTRTRRSRSSSVSIANFADAKLGLNVGKMIGLIFRGDRDIAIHCGAVSFDVHGGAGKSREIVLDTAQTHIEGIGTRDLRRERWDLLLTPQPKKPGLLTRHASIRVEGSFRGAHASLDERIPLTGNDRVLDAGASPDPCSSSGRRVGHPGRPRE